MKNRIAHRLIQRILQPGQSIEIPFVPGAAKNVEAGSINDGDTILVLELLFPGETAAPPERRDQGTQAVLQVSAQATPSQVAGRHVWRARLTSRSAVPTSIELDVKYPTDEPLSKVVIPAAKLATLATTAVAEAKPTITFHGEQLKIGLDPSLSRGHESKLDRNVDLPYYIKIWDLVSERVTLSFKPPDADFIAGSIEIKVACAKDVTIAAPLTRFTLRKPTFTVRIGINLYGGSIRLQPLILDLPPVDPANWIGSLLGGAVDIRARATRTLTETLEAAIADLVDSGKLADARRRIEVALGMARLESLGITPEGLELEYVAPIAASPAAPVSVGAGVGRSPNLKHLVIVMMENRSFDHMMASLVADRPDVDRAPARYEETFDGKTYRRAPTTMHTLPHDPPHDSASQKLQANGEFVRSFFGGNPGSPYGNEVLNYQPRHHVPFYEFLTEHFCICDNWRAALPGHTWPNRLYSLSGRSNNTLDNPAMSRFAFYTMPTICDVLEAQHVPWAYFKQDFAFLELYRRWVTDDRRIQPHTQFEAAIADAAANTRPFPTVSWIEPNISDFGASLGSDDHPPIGILPGQAFLAGVYDQLCKLPTKDWLLVITYDENGGFYDHVKPEPAHDDDDNTKMRGFRVPAFFVSPWIKPGSVCSIKFDHASLIRTVLDQFCNTEPIFDRSVTRVREATSFAHILDAGSQYALAAPLVPPRFPGVPGAIAGGGMDMLGLGGDLPTPHRHPLFAKFVEMRDELIRGVRPVAAPGGLGMGAAAGAAEETPPAPRAPAPPPLPPTEPVTFEGLYIEHLVPPAEMADWTSEPVFDDAVIVRPPAAMSVDAAWDFVHDLRGRYPGVTIDPLWETMFPAMTPRGSEVDPLVIAGGPAAAPEDKTWQLTLLRAREAWTLKTQHAQQGEGIVVGHLDTGYRDHKDLAEMWQPKYGWDVLDDDDDPHDDLVTGVLQFPGHGTSTGSVIGSRGGAEPVMGTAPCAQLIPFRMSTTVVHLSMTRMVRALRRAVEAGAHVISISAGGLWSAALHRAVRDAVAVGVVVVAAAGNYTKIVAWPARYDEVIACGAVHADGTPWRWSNGATGDNVDVMAPGADVWVLRTHGDGAIATEPGSGTSFATACVAGAVATWLGFHGRDPLIARYGRPNLAGTIKDLIVKLTRKPDGSAGILDMEALLAAPLPDPGVRAVLAPTAIAPVSSLDALGLARAVDVHVAPGEQSVADEVAFHAMVAALAAGAAATRPSAHLTMARARG